MPFIALPGESESFLRKSEALSRESRRFPRTPRRHARRNAVAARAIAWRKAQNPAGALSAQACRLHCAGLQKACYFPVAIAALFSHIGPACGQDAV
ncbi:hypothetical protein [Mesorhizobium sp. BH1-1-4]|uniref:hypothetical protein n=1 Tax=Mesorhizobium sp. BH1-1-4 TaxID=2876662 RepID=UPI001CD1561A|nr:hypothetical protein [Mesorhizobium sp. BH1-1-4]MBZ9997826.1 hypothetical protein [Mesorhizobium sp. BH1-1-4]